MNTGISEFAPRGASSTASVLPASLTHPSAGADDPAEVTEPYITFPVRSARTDSLPRHRPDEHLDAADAEAAALLGATAAPVSDSRAYVRLEQAAYGVGERAGADLDRVGVQILAALHAGDLTDRDARCLALTALTRCRLVEEEARKYTRHHHTLAEEVIARVYESMLSKVMDPDVCGAWDTSRSASIAGWARASIRNLVRQKTRDVRRAESSSHLDVGDELDRLDIDDAVDEVVHVDQDTHLLRARLLVDEWSEGIRDAVATGYALLRVPPALRPRSFRLRTLLARAIAAESGLRPRGSSALAHRSLTAFSSGALRPLDHDLVEVVVSSGEVHDDLLVAALSDLWLGYDAATCAAIESFDDAEAWTSFLAADALAAWARPSVKRIRAMSGALARLCPGRDWQRLATCLLDGFLAHEFEPVSSRERLDAGETGNLDAYGRCVAARFDELCARVAEHPAHPLGSTATEVADMLHVLGGEYLESPTLTRFLPQRGADPALAAAILQKARRPGPRPVGREASASVEARVAALRLVDGGRTTFATLATLATVPAARSAAAIESRIDQLHGRYDQEGVDASGVA